MSVCNEQEYCCKCGRSDKEYDLIQSDYDDTFWCVDCADLYAQEVADSMIEDANFEARRDNGNGKSPTSN